MDILLLALPAVMILLLVSQSRKRKKDAASLVDSLQTGSNVILYAGIKGKVISIDGEDLELETTPGTKLRVVKQSVRAIESTEGN